MAQAYAGRAIIAVLGGLLAAAACRDGPTLFIPEDDAAPLGPAPYRLTFEPDRDVTPTWSVTGDTIFYLVERVTFNPFPPMEAIRVTGVAYAIPREGGTAVLVFPVIQSADGLSVSLRYVEQAPDGTLAAYALGPLHGALCAGGEGLTAICTSPVDSTPRLKSATVRLRAQGSVGPPESDPIFAIEYEGREFDTSEHPLGLDGLYRVWAHPFQQLYSESRRVSSRVSWSAEGDRLVLSNGLRLLIWSPSSGTVAAIPGSDDGLNPAWSPAGDWIAFERLERGSVSQAVCEYQVAGRTVCFEERTTWTIPSRSLAIVRPDGSSLRLLPEGDNPAWSFDGQRIFYESAGAIWSVGIEGTGAAPVAGTENGHEPALSPDGRHLAFSRVDPLTGEADLWVVDAP